MTGRHRPLLRLLSAFLIALAACGAPAKPSSVIAPAPDPTSEPSQTPANTAPFTLQLDDYAITITPVAAYEIHAEIVSTKRYRFGWNALLSPVDLALAWGELTSDEAKKHISYSQGNRWYYFRYDSESPHDVGFISRHSANVHILPANENLEAAALSLDEGDRVRLAGYLVNVDGKTANGRTVWWRSSQTREDSGDGSCEVMWVTEIQSGKKIYR